MTTDATRSYIPPQPIHWFDDGSFRPHVYALKGKRDPRTFKLVYFVPEGARDATRGVDRRWVREMYSFAVKPDLAVFFRVPIEVSVDRLMAHFENRDGFE